MDSPQIPTLAIDAQELPANLEAEQGLLGAILSDNRVLDHVDGIVSHDRFHESVHAQIYQLMARMIRGGQLVNPVTLNTAFADHETLKDLGGARQYLGAVAAASCGSLAAPDYARIIRDMACCRDLIRIAEEAKARAYDRSIDGDDWSTIAGSVRQRIDDLSAGMTDDRVVTGEQVIQSLAMKLESGVKVIKTGIERLDRSFGGGMRAGCLYAFEGQAKRFKTGFGTAIFSGVVRGGHKVMFLTLEMSPDDIFQREVAGMAGLNFMALEDERYKERNIKRVFEYQRSMGGLKNAMFMHIPGASYSELMAYVSRACSEYRCDLVVVDYWQRIRGEDTKKTEAANLEMVANHLADLLQKTGMSGVLLSQLNDEDKSLGSRGLQRACSWRGLIQKEEFPTADPDFTRAGLWVDVQENRYGPSGHVGDPKSPAFEIATGPVLKEWNA